MESEFHQLDVRYERLRVRQPARERRLLVSLADAGQQIRIVVVATGAAYVVVDGHKRVRLSPAPAARLGGGRDLGDAGARGVDLSAVAAHRRDRQRARAGLAA